MFDHWLKWYIKNRFNWIGSFEARCLWLRSKKVKKDHGWSFNNNFGPVASYTCRILHGGERLFMFEWQEYLSVLANGKQKIHIFEVACVLFILSTYCWRRFWRFFEYFRSLPKDFRRFSEGCPKVTRTLRTFLKLSEHCPRLSRKTRRW